MKDDSHMTMPGNFIDSRRTALSRLASAILSVPALTRQSSAEEPAESATDDRVLGMLLGTFIGDAAGGPVEFLEAEQAATVLPNARDWPSSRRLDKAELQQLADSFPLLSYAKLRPETAPYGPWQAAATAGTITDDSRMKIILMRAVARVAAETVPRLSEQLIADELIRFQPLPDVRPEASLQALIDEGLAEYRMAARWLLGERDESRALPVERLWGGIANCSGQMMMLPLAAIYPGNPQAAYRTTYELDFIDAPLARDFCAALNAGLAAALAPALQSGSPRHRWQALLTAMADTDPFRYRDLPFVGRPLIKWLKMSEKMARDAKGSPAVLYRTLEDYGQPVYWWDAHFTLLVPLSLLHLCDFNPLAALHLCLDFGHDTDSYAQVLGAMAGAVHGPQLFPAVMRSLVTEHVQSTYGENLAAWPALLNRAAQLAR